MTAGGVSPMFLSVPPPREWRERRTAGADPVLRNRSEPPGGMRDGEHRGPFSSPVLLSGQHRPDRRFRKCLSPELPPRFQSAQAGIRGADLPRAPQAKGNPGDQGLSGRQPDRSGSRSGRDRRVPGPDAGTARRLHPQGDPAGRPGGRGFFRDRRRRPKASGRDGRAGPRERGPGHRSQCAQPHQPPHRPGRQLPCPGPPSRRRAFPDLPVRPLRTPAALAVPRRQPAPEQAH